MTAYSHVRACVQRESEPMLLPATELRGDSMCFQRLFFNSIELNVHARSRVFQLLVSTGGHRSGSGDGQSVSHHLP